MNSIYAMEESSLNKYLSIYDNAALHEAINKYAGQVDYKTYDVTYHGNVGVIHISGIISRHADMLASFLGMGSAAIENIAKDFQSLLDNDEVKSIILDFDTPGGAITGVNELAEIIYNARGIKPIKAYVTGMACSAGYFLAAACDEIIIDEMGSVGSIGVMRVVSKSNEKSVIFKSSQSPMKNVEAESELGKAEYQAKVDYLASIFIDKVAKYRGITSDEVINRGNKGGVLVGAVAVTAGLADRLGSMDMLINELNNKGKKENHKEIKMQENEKLEEKTVDTAQIEANAVAAERKRVAELMAIQVPGCEKLVQEAISSGASVADTNARIVAYIQSEEYKASFQKEEHAVVQAVEPIVAGADMLDMSKEDTQVNAMLELSKQFEKSVR
ncbi:MAG TPA: S49 family peptidase [Candidatus Mucispirillum faecigallinarum]|uniref:S49 family peptidase n=1 Tax=Candidatus Mucispirillum faecigallinarum TaxID=2838699 RepID=A0A9D2KCH6_9BACT|nr:S49 family peptidase [Candidatus Mucispirillum faecigallinarum]